MALPESKEPELGMVVHSEYGERKQSRRTEVKKILSRKTLRDTKITTERSLAFVCLFVCRLTTLEEVTLWLVVDIQRASAQNRHPPLYMVLFSQG